MSMVLFYHDVVPTDDYPLDTRITKYKFDITLGM